LAAACLQTAETCYYVAKHHFACGVKESNEGTPTNTQLLVVARAKTCTSSPSCSKWLEYADCPCLQAYQLPRAAGSFEGKDSQHILLHLTAVNGKQC
jgi:hypothetical protein